MHPGEEVLDLQHTTGLRLRKKNFKAPTKRIAYNLPQFMTPRMLRAGHDLARKLQAAQNCICNTPLCIELYLIVIFEPENWLGGCLRKKSGEK